MRIGMIQEPGDLPSNIIYAPSGYGVMCTLKVISLGDCPGWIAKQGAAIFETIFPPKTESLVN
jgi:hypothetical protein